MGCSADTHSVADGKAPRNRLRGESKNFLARIRDLLIQRHHPFRRHTDTDTPAEQFKRGTHRAPHGSAAEPGSCHDHNSKPLS